MKSLMKKALGSIYYIICGIFSKYCVDLQNLDAQRKR